MIDPPAPTIVGRYVLHAPIARGGMATIHLARLLGAEGFSRTVAAKRLHPQFTEDAEFLRRTGVLAVDRIRAVQTGACPHTAIRDDISANLDTVDASHWAPDNWRLQ